MIKAKVLIFVNIKWDSYIYIWYTSFIQLSIPCKEIGNLVNLLNFSQFTSIAYTDYITDDWRRLK